MLEAESELIERLRVLNMSGARELSDVIDSRLAKHRSILEADTDHLKMIREQGAIEELKWFKKTLEYIRKPRID